MLYKFIGRNGKRKATESRSHQKPSLASEQSLFASPLVFDINEESIAAQSSPLVQLNLSNSNEEWFPQELLRSRTCSPDRSPQRVQNATVTQNTLTQETRTNPSPVPSLSHSENSASCLPARKKSIPAPIKIPDNVLPNIQIGYSAVPSRALPPETSQLNANGASGSSPSASMLDDLSAISGTTLARTLIASSFVLSSERRSSRHRSGVVRQDSATLPRGSFFLSDSRSSSPIPPVPPVPTMLASATPDPNHPSTTIKSGTSTESEYPMTDSYITSPETADSSVISQRISHVTKSLPPAVPATKPQRKAGLVPTRSRVPKNGIFDEPKPAVEVPLLLSPRETTQDSSQEGSALLSSDDRSLDEFDFMPPETLVMVGSPSSDSSASYIPRKRGDSNRGQWRRRAGGMDRTQNSSKDSSLADGAFGPQQTLGISSATTSEHDFGELLNYDLISPESGASLSSASAGYQTFPETPMVCSPLWSSGFAFFARSDSQVVRRRMSSLKSARRGSGKVHTRTARRQVGNNDGGNISQSSLLAKRPPPSPKQAERSLPPPVPAIDDARDPDETNEPLKTDTAESQQAVKSSPAVRPRPLAHISSSSSCLLEEEALRALARHSSSSSPFIDISNVDPSFDPTTEPVSVTDTSVKSPTSIPLPESTDVSLSNSPALASVSPLASHLLQPPISQSPLSFPPSFLGGSSSFLPSTSTSTSSASPSLSRTPSADPIYQRSRQASNSSLASGSARTRMRSRPPLPVGPRKPTGPGQGIGSFFPGIRGRNGSASSVASSDPTVSAGFPWRKLQSAASKPPPKFQTPPPKWRGLTLEAAQWTFTSAQLQEIVSQAIQQSFEGSSLRFLKPEILEGEIADELECLELQHMDVKAQYKALARKRWMLMGALAGHVEGVAMSDATTAERTLEELAEVLSALDLRAEKMHDIVLQIAQLQRLREVHNTSALAMAVRKINRVFVRQMAEKERLQGQVDTLATERDEAWKHAEDIAQDYDTLNDRVSEAACDNMSADAQSVTTSSRRSTRISAVRKSSIRQSQAGLRSRSRGRRSPSNSGRPTSLTLIDIPPVPRLPVNPAMGTSALPTTGIPFGSVCDTSLETSSSATLALAEAQREVYEMLGLSLPPSQASSRRRTLSGPISPTPLPSPSVRPVSDSFDPDGRTVRPSWRVRSRQERRRAIKSVTLDDRFYHVRPLTVAQR
ncbi:hypothetical protein L210DRAFT_3639154 [Boletus edulis BED1]|uniref:Uncharacterized protein n=1 Tax=Boletus edulis BED1 TaxID=1328754 RepID=A0AAD4C9A8_BOLED|nr:hypothetical protein L210DRAFT_3639154 [Boletus edulis BED1]